MSVLTIGWNGDLTFVSLAPLVSGVLRATLFTLFYEASISYLDRWLLRGKNTSSSPTPDYTSSPSARWTWLESCLTTPGRSLSPDIDLFSPLATIFGTKLQHESISRWTFADLPQDDRTDLSSWSSPCRLWHPNRVGWAFRQLLRRGAARKCSRGRCCAGGLWVVYQAGGQNLDSSDSRRLYHCHEGGKLRPIYNIFLEIWRWNWYHSI